MFTNLVNTNYLIYERKWSVNHSLMSDSLQTMDYSPPGFSIHGILQARILKWVSISSPGNVPDPIIELESPALQAYSFFFFFPRLWYLLISVTQFFYLLTHPLLWQPPNCSLYLWLFLFVHYFDLNILHINEVTQYLFFYVWLISLHIISSRCIHVVANGEIWFSFMVN